MSVTANLVWSVALAVVGILGIYLAGRKNLWGWAIGTGAQVLWIVFAIATEQYGFILSALAYGAVYGRNWYRWAAESGPWRTPRSPWQRLTWHASGNSEATLCGRPYGNDFSIHGHRVARFDATADVDCRQCIAVTQRLLALRTAN